MLLGFRVRCLCNLCTICCTYTHLKTLLTCIPGCGGPQRLDGSNGFISWQVSRPAAELGGLLGSGNATNRSVQEPVQKWENKKAMWDDKCKMCISRVELWIAWTWRRWPILWIRKLAAIKLSPQHRSSCNETMELQSKCIYQHIFLSQELELSTTFKMATNSKYRWYPWWYLNLIRSSAEDELCVVCRY